MKPTRLLVQAPLYADHLSCVHSGLFISDIPVHSFPYLNFRWWDMMEYQFPRQFLHRISNPVSNPRSDISYISSHISIIVFLKHVKHINSQNNSHEQKVIYHDLSWFLVCLPEGKHEFLPKKDHAGLHGHSPPLEAPPGPQRSRSRRNAGEQKSAAIGFRLGECRLDVATCC